MAKKYAFEIASGQKSKHLTDAEYIKGSYFVANSITAMEEMPVCTENNDGVIIKGSFCYCTEDSKFYQYDGTEWLEKNFNSDKINIHTTESGYKQELEFKIEDRNDGQGRYYFVKACIHTQDDTKLDTPDALFSYICNLPLPDRKVIVKPVYKTSDTTDHGHIIDFPEDFKSTLAIDIEADRSLKIGVEANTNFSFPLNWLEICHHEISSCNGYLQVDDKDVATVDTYNYGSLIKLANDSNLGRIGIISTEFAQTYFSESASLNIPRPVYKSPDNDYHKIVIEEDLDAVELDIIDVINSNTVDISSVLSEYTSTAEKVKQTELPSGTTNYPILTSTASTPTSDTAYGARYCSSIKLNGNGQLTASSFYATSDKRKKENIKEFVPQKSILDLPVVEFDFKDSGVHQIGCIAQDLQEICPEIVSADESGYLSINESKIVYLLLDEVKKLRKEVNELRNK